MSRRFRAGERRIIEGAGKLVTALHLDARQMGFQAVFGDALQMSIERRVHPQARLVQRRAVVLDQNATNLLGEIGAPLLAAILALGKIEWLVAGLFSLLLGDSVPAPIIRGRSSVFVLHVSCVSPRTSRL